MKKWLLPVYILPILLFALCSQSPVEPISTVCGDYYTILIPVLNQDSVCFSYTTSSGNRFILPCHYFDNPLELIDGPLIRDLTIIDANGDAVDTISTTEQIGPVTNRILILPEKTAFPVTFSYRLDITAIRHDPTAKMMPEVHLRDSSLFLIGAYCFILPRISGSLTALWRESHSVRITMAASPAITLYGIPASSFTCKNLYELLFLQISGGREPIAKGRGGGTEFVFLDYLNKTYPPGRFDSLALNFSAILDDIASQYGPFTGAPYTVGIHNIWGGLEGTFGFAIGEPAEGPDSRFSEILAHEALHHFIGIRCGDYDDQWWKESAATWLGLETSVRLGFYPKESFRQRMIRRFDLADTVRFQRPLSDPWLRSHMFADTLHMLVYDRGAQVMMLLDLLIRMGSRNRFTLNDATADLCKRFSGGAFTRADFLSTLEHYGASDAPALFSALVDAPDSVMSEMQLVETFTQLDSLEDAW